MSKEIEDEKKREEEYKAKKITVSELGTPLTESDLEYVSNTELLFRISNQLSELINKK